MLDIIFHGEIAELKLNRPPANALNEALLDALINGHRQVLNDGARGVILSGQDGMFCAGIDVPELLGQQRTAIHSFWATFFESARMLASSPVPVVAALGGHSPAGGAVLAAHCDYRIAGGENFKIGFNEVQVGLPLPAEIMLVFEELVGLRTARELGTRGALVTMEEALRIGLVDEIVAPDQLMRCAAEWLESLLALPPIAMNRTRLGGKARLLAALKDVDDVDQATEDWFSDETQQSMQALVDNLRK